MPLIADAACDADLTARFVGQTDITYIYSHISRISTKLAAKTMQSPVPYRTSIIDHVRGEMDELTIEGFLGCAGCTQATSSIGFIRDLKIAITNQTYHADDFFDIFTNRARYSRMILVGVDINESDTRHQFINVTTNWLGANLAGTITTPSYEAGGVF